VRITVIGAGAVGGYYGGMLARAGHDVAFVARGAHLAAIRQRGLTVRATRGEFTVRPHVVHPGEAATPAELVMLAVKTYDNQSALQLLDPLTASDGVVLTLQNGVDSPMEAAGVVGAARVLGGAAYIAAAIASPGVIEQTGTHHRLVFGEVFETSDSISRRVEHIRETLAGAGIDAAAVSDARVSLWEKYVYLAPFAGFTGTARAPIGPLWRHGETQELFIRGCSEVAAVARAEGVLLPADVPDRVRTYAAALPPSTRSSLLIDLQQGKPIEVEALLGALVRRARAHGVDMPVMETLYAALRDHAAGQRS
jgi:2-dehydropantoate 2-reductase